MGAGEGEPNYVLVDVYTSRMTDIITPIHNRYSIDATISIQIIIRTIQCCIGRETSFQNDICYKHVTIEHVTTPSSDKIFQKYIQNTEHRKYTCYQDLYISLIKGLITANPSYLQHLRQELTFQSNLTTPNFKTLTLFFLHFSVR